jgi:hypothetical protein
MLDKLLDEAASARDKQEAERLVRQLANSPDEAIGVVVKALRQPGKHRQAVAIRVIRLIGYPKNASAIQELVYHIGDPNLPGWQEAVNTLVEMGPDAVVPNLVQTFLDMGRTWESWADDVDGLCCMLNQIKREYALRCCPAVNYLLSQDNLPKSPDIDSLLDVVEQGGRNVDYVLPTLIALAKKHHDNDLGRRARKLISSFNKETLDTYRLLLPQLGD